MFSGISKAHAYQLSYDRLTLNFNIIIFSSSLYKKKRMTISNLTLRTSCRVEYFVDG